MLNIQTQIESKLTTALKPTYLLVENESHMHNVPKGSESHFKVTVVSEQFTGLTLIKRHRLLNQILAAHLKDDIHALALHTLTPREWEQKDNQVTATPNCRGGFKS